MQSLTYALVVDDESGDEDDDVIDYNHYDDAFM